MNVILFGQKHFACEIAKLIRSRPDWRLCAVSAPPGDRLRHFATYRGTAVLDGPGNLRAEHLREVCGGSAPDLIVTAHCHDFIPTHVRQAARFGAIGYHPSLLPLRRGRHAVEDAVREGDRVTGGTVYRLDDGWDTGPVIAQRHAFVRESDTAQTLWRETLAPLGIELFHEAFDVISGELNKSSASTAPKKAS